MSRNVVIIGHSGVGKSPLINMLHPAACADTSNDTIGCTKAEQEYGPCYIGNRSYQLHDTIGLEEGKWGFLWAPKAEKRLCEYLKSVGNPRLLVFCMTGARGDKKSLGRIYKKFKSAVGGNVVVVVTKLENSRGPLENWWNNPGNQSILGKIGIPSSVEHACITMIPEDDRYNTSCEAVKALIWNNLRSR